MTEALRPVPLDLPPRRGPGGALAVAGALAVVALLVLWLHLVGRSFLCSCGDVRFWQGELTPRENSQQFSDWYSALHVVFGIGLFAFVHRMRPRWALARKLLVVIASSAVWEAIENMPFVIALFQEPSDALRYHGDSILNSLGDTVFVLFGAVLAAVLPPWTTLLVALAAELTVSLAINDGLILGTLRLIGIDV